MKASAFQRELEAVHRATGFGVFTTGTLMNSIMAGDHKRTCEKTIAVAVNDGLLVRLCRGIYRYKHASPLRPSLQEAVLLLRPRAHNYISLESALGCWGVIEQHVLGGITVMTDGRGGRLATPHGAIQLTHTAKSYERVRSNLVMATEFDLLPTALPRLAAKELMRVGRNTDLLDMTQVDVVEAELRDAI